MKKMEQLIAVEDFLSVKGVTLDDFYSVEVNNMRVLLQGHFKDELTRKIGTDEFAVMPTGYVKARLLVTLESNEPIEVLITLT